jgi:hypothetical protein
MPVSGVEGDLDQMLTIDTYRAGNSGREGDFLCGLFSITRDLISGS